MFKFHPQIESWNSVLIYNFAFSVLDFRAFILILRPLFLFPSFCFHLLLSHNYYRKDKPDFQTSEYITLSRSFSWNKLAWCSQSSNETVQWSLC